MKLANKALLNAETRAIEEFEFPVSINNKTIPILLLSSDRFMELYGKHETSPAATASFPLLELLSHDDQNDLEEQYQSVASAPQRSTFGGKCPRFGPPMPQTDSSSDNSSESEGEATSPKQIKVQKRAAVDMTFYRQHAPKVINSKGTTSVPDETGTSNNYSRKKCQLAKERGGKCPAVIYEWRDSTGRSCIVCPASQCKVNLHKECFMLWHMEKEMW